MTLVLRSEKGSPLSISEGDGNFVHLQNQIDTLSLGAERIPSNRFIGGFTNSPNALPGNLHVSQLAIIGDDIYLFGGHNGSASLNIIYKSNISNPTSWTNTGSTLPGILSSSQLAIIGDDIYLFGGNNGSASINIIYKSNISNPIIWEDTRIRLNSNLYAHNLLYLNNKLYIYGGCDGSAYLNTIRVADLNTYKRAIYRENGHINDFSLGRELSDHELSGIAPWIIAA